MREPGAAAQLLAGDHCASDRRIDGEFLPGLLFVHAVVGSRALCHLRRVKRRDKMSCEIPMRASLAVAPYQLQDGLGHHVNLASRVDRHMRALATELTHNDGLT